MKLEWTEPARADLARIYAFNADRNEAFADRVETPLLTRVQALRVSPFQGRPVRKAGLRAISVPDIQYVITYRVEPETVWIVEVRSTREDRDERDR